MREEIIEAEVEDPPTVTQLATREPDALVVPVANQQEIVAAFQHYADARNALLRPEDFQEFTEWGKKSRFVKRSGWRKLAIAYSVTFEIIERVILRDDRDVVFDAEFIVRATAPNGRYADGWGACSGYERCCQTGCRKKHRHCPGEAGERCTVGRHFSKPRHDIPATAETRAKNRACADLFGMGEVSAEEMTADTAPPRPVEKLAKVEGDDGELYAELVTLIGNGPDEKTKATLEESTKRMFQLMVAGGMWPDDAYKVALEGWCGSRSKEQWEGGGGVKLEVVSEWKDLGKKDEMLLFAGRWFKFARSKVEAKNKEDDVEGY